MKRAVLTASEEEHSQQQATSTKGADDNDAGERCRRRCPRQCLEVQLIDKTVGVPVQTPAHSIELRTIRWWRRDNCRPFRRSRKTVEIPQAEFMSPCHTEVLEIRSSRRLWSSHRSSTLRASSTERLICPFLREIMSPWSRQRRTPLRSNKPITLTRSQVSVMMRRQV